MELYGYGDMDYIDVTANVSWTWYIDYYDDWGWLNVTRINSSGNNGTLRIEATNTPPYGSWEAEIVVSGGGVTRYITVYLN